MLTTIEPPHWFTFKRGCRSPHRSVDRNYQTGLTFEGYAVENEREPGSVQIYPLAALERVGKSE